MVEMVDECDAGKEDPFMNVQERNGGKKRCVSR